MTVEHLQPLLDHTKMQECFSRWQRGWPEHRSLQVWLTALQKPDGGVGGIVAGATAPFQHALATRAGCECVAHALQGITELNPRATVTSIDGISAFDLISRRAMMQGLHDVDHRSAIRVHVLWNAVKVLVGG